MVNGRLFTVQFSKLSFSSLPITVMQQKREHVNVNYSCMSCFPRNNFIDKAACTYCILCVRETKRTIHRSVLHAKNPQI